MPSSKHILLLTGTPGVGKTTVIQKIIKGLPVSSIAGFYTEEIRKHNIRQGFELVTLTGARTVIAHVDISSPYRVRKYGVDVPAIDAAVEKTLFLKNNLYIIDEIGKMECFSEKFIDAMETLLNSKTTVVATVAMRGKGFIEKVKNRDDCELWEITKKNRDAIDKQVLEWIKVRTLK